MVRLPLSVTQVIGLSLFLLVAATQSVCGQTLTSQFSDVLRTEPRNEHHRVKRYPVESARVVNTICPNRCYRHLVKTIGPVNITGLVEIQIESPPGGKAQYNYSNDWEAFERTCWAYRRHTTRCLRECDASTDKTWLQEVFFNILHNYCVDFYDSLVVYWQCYQKLAEQGGECERRCRTSCRVDCSTKCNRPLSKSLCGTEQPLEVLIQVVRRVLPKIVESMIANGERLVCEQEISHFLRAK